MIRSLLFRWLLSKNRFAHALARCRPDASIRSAGELHAAYRLGLYSTVAGSVCKDRHWRGRVAMAVSLAACGRTAEAAAVVKTLSLETAFERHATALAEALAPFAPSLALEMLDGRQGSWLRCCCGKGKRAARRAFCAKQCVVASTPVNRN